MSEATELLIRCNELEGLDLSLNLAVDTAPDLSELRQYLYHRDGQLLGFLSAEGTGDVEISLGVDPACRRQGIGRQLLAAARVDCLKNGSTAWMLVIDEAAASGKAFVRAIGATYRSSEYRLTLSRQNVPAPRTWTRLVELRPASVEDASRLGQLVAAAFGDPPEETIRWVSRDLTKPNHRFWIASLDGEPIGQIRANWYEDVSYITAFGVLPRHRGQGYGRQILLATVERLVQEHWSKIRIEVATDNANALGLYRSCGFELTTAYGYYHQTI